MNTIKSSFYGSYYNNAKNINTAKLHTIKFTHPQETGTDNLKTNYWVSFKGGRKCETSNDSNIGTLNHQTAFFREPDTDEIVQKYILEKFGKDKEINIISGACSTGEEAKSYAMMLDTLKDKLNIHGFDISAETVEEAKNNDCQLIKQEDNFPLNFLCSNSENALMEDNADELTGYQRKCYDKFRQYYTPKGPQRQTPKFPNAKQELKDLETVLNNKEEFEKQKKEYYEQMQTIKNAIPEFAGYMENISFEDAIEIQKRGLEQNVQAYIVVRDFKADEHSFDNCTFEQGNILNLQKLYKPNSANVLLYKNALYHTLCMGDNMFRCMKDDAEDTMDLIAKQMNKVVKNQGLVVFGEDEFLQGIDTNIIKEAMENNGFKLLKTNKENKNIWIKIKDMEG